MLHTAPGSGTHYIAFMCAPKPNGNPEVCDQCGPNLRKHLAGLLH